jgi:ferrous iron transport protein A
MVIKVRVVEDSSSPFDSNHLWNQYVTEVCPHCDNPNMKNIIEKPNGGSGESRKTSSAGRSKNLSEALHGVWHQVESLAGPEDACYRLQELGFTPGAEVKVAQAAPLGEPLVVVLRGTRLALRKDEAAWIIVE